MSIQYYLDGKEAIRFAKAYPAGMGEYRIPCNQVYGATGSFGNILIQEIVTPNFTIRYTVYEIREEIDFGLRADEPLLVMQLVLENELKWNFASLDQLLVKEGCWNLVYLPDPVGICSFKQGTYVNFDIHFSGELLFSLQDYFSFLSGFITSIKSAQPAILLQRSFSFSKESREIVDRVLNYHYEKEILFLYTDHYTRNLVLLLLREAGHTQSMYGAVPPDIVKMYHVQKQLETDLVHMPQLDRIAIDLAMSTSKLNKYFNRMFGKSPKEYWKERRLERAAEELKNSPKPVKQIVKELGYKQGAFFDAFRKKFGMTPQEWRRKF